MNARARLIRARTMIVNVRADVGQETALRDRLAEVLHAIDDILHAERYLPDMPAVREPKPREGP